MTMREVLKMLFVIAFVVIVVQSVKTAYAGWFGRTVSLLAKYEKPDDAVELAARPLADLMRGYESARLKVAAYEEDPGHPVVEEDARDETEPYASERRWHAAVEEREEQEQRLGELRYHCRMGIALILAGTLCFARLNELAGVSALIAGFSLLVGYASPASWRVQHVPGILAHQMAYSVASFVLLLAAAHFTGTFSRETAEAAVGDGTSTS